MSIPGVSPQLIAPIFITKPPHEEGVKKTISSHDLLVLAMASYLNVVHETIMQAWDRFSKVNESLAEDNRQDQKTREAQHHHEEATRLLSLRRHMQSQHIDDSTRHLNFPA